MSITSEQLKTVSQRLVGDPAWQEVSPELQKELLDDLHAVVASSILDSHITDVQNEEKKSKAKRAPRKKKDSETKE